MVLPAGAQSTPTAAPPSIATSPGAPASGPGDRAKRDADVFHWILIHSDKPRRPNQTRDERLSATAAARAKPTPNTPIKADEAPPEVPVPAKIQMIATLDPTAVPAAIAADPAIERTTDKVTVRQASPQAIAPTAPSRSPLIERTPVGPVEPATTMAVTERNVVLSKVEVEPPAVDRAEPAPALGTTPAAVAPAPVPAPISNPTSAPATDETADEPGAESLKPLTRADPQFSAAMMRTLRKGKVEVQFTVQPDGSVSEPSVVTTSNAKLNAVALAAIAKWRFAPISKPQLGVVDMVFDIDAE